MTVSVGIQSIAIALPEKKVENNYWLENYPELVKGEAGWLWQKKNLQKNKNNTFNQEMAPYLDDIFRGAKQRYFLDSNESVLSLEIEAAKEAIYQADIKSEKIDLLISTSFLSDRVGVGNAAYLSKALDLQRAAWNMESACSSFSVALDTAVAFIQAGRYKNILVVTSCCYSKNVDLNTPLSLGVGDAAVSILVSSSQSAKGYLGGWNRHSAETIGSVCFKTEASRKTGYVKHYLTPKGDVAREKLRDSSTLLLQHCVDGVLKNACLSLEDIDYFIFNSPMAWYTKFCISTLKITPDKTHDIFPYYTNIGASLPGVSLYHAAFEGKIRKKDKVLIYSIGSESSASAIILEWGDVKVGRLPQNAPEKIHTL